jgi:hypothetical protein
MTEQNCLPRQWTTSGREDQATTNKKGQTVGRHKRQDRLWSIHIKQREEMEFKAVN